MVWPGPVYFPELLWDEAEHPRWPADSPGSRGGQFRSKSGPGLVSSGTERWIQTALTGVGIDLDEDQLRDAIARGREVARTPLHGGSIGQTSIVTMELPDGQRVALVHKRQDGEFSNREVWASRIARAIGAPVSAVIHDPDDENSIYLSYIEGHAALHRALDISADTGDSEYGILNDLTQEHAGTRRGALLGLLDIVLLNADRHGGNWMIDHENQAWGIDHTHIQPWSDDDYQGYEDFGTSVMDGDTPLTVRDIAEAQARIGDLVDDHRIPTEWWPGMQMRLQFLQDLFEQRNMPLPEMSEDALYEAVTSMVPGAAEEYQRRRDREAVPGGRLGPPR